MADLTWVGSVYDEKQTRELKVQVAHALKRYFQNSNPSTFKPLIKISELISDNRIKFLRHFLPHRIYKSEFGHSYVVRVCKLS